MDNNREEFMLVAKRFVILLALSIPLILSACGGSSGGVTPPPITRGSVVSINGLSKSQYSLAELQLLRSSMFSALSGFAAYMQHDVAAYKVVYRTITPDGKAVNASGILLLPLNITPGQTPIVSYQHGTIFDNTNAPTNLLPAQQFAAVIASMNLIVIMPDYIGYGESLAELHPYMHTEGLANSVIDLIRAVKSHLTTIGVTTNGKLYLSGYSEGGYAAVAAHKLIQERFSNELSITATSAGAGAYDLATTAQTQLAGPTMTYGENVAFVYKAYDSIYGLNRLDEVFNEAYVNIINSYFDGSHSETSVAADIPDETATLMKEPFLSDFRADGEQALKQLFTANSIHDWRPDAPIRFFHGNQDITSPYQNSVSAVNAMQARGATQVELVQCTAIPADHLHCSTPYIIDMLGYILGL